VPRLAFALSSASGKEILTVPVTGGTPRRLVPGAHNDGFCLSADERRMAYYSDEQVPQEPFLYLAGSDGSRPRLITNRQVGFLCRFSDRFIVLSTAHGAARELRRHDLRSGSERKLAAEVDRAVQSPDGATLVFVGGLTFHGGAQPAGRERLQVVRLADLRPRTLAGPLPKGRSFGGLPEDTIAVSPDGTLVAYSRGGSAYPPHAWGAGARRVIVQPLDGGAPRQVASVVGSAPVLKWSADSRVVLVCAPGIGQPQSGCRGGEPAAEARLSTVPAAGGPVREIATGAIVFAGFMPDSADVAYATTAGLFVAQDGRTRTVADAPREGWPGGDWIGFSPDGRYLGLGSFSPRIAVIDMTTGRFQLVFRERENTLTEYLKWWP
jgi:hypothetical protein